MQWEFHKAKNYMENKMSVYKKLMQARIKLQSMSLSKSGHNKFAGYQYFELSDFLPQTQTIFNEVGLCGIVSFGELLATLDIYDVEGGGIISITSPMKEANLKGCHAIQNLGAVETYTRRYLWVTAMEIVEHDALDSSAPLEAKPASKVSPAPNLKPPPVTLSELKLAAEQMHEADNMETLQGIFAGIYKRANDNEKQGLKQEYDLNKARLEKE